MSNQYLAKPGQYTYTPVLGFSSIHGLKNLNNPTKENICGQRATWWDDHSILDPNHQYVFINPTTTGTQFSNEGTEVRDRITQDTDAYIMCDSGGFQVMTNEDAYVADHADETDWRNAQIHPETLAEFQVANSDAGIVFDFPPYPPDAKGGRYYGEDSWQDWKDDVFREWLSISEDNTERMFDVWDDMGIDSEHPFERIGVVQGQPAKEGRVDSLLREWHQGAESVGEYDAWALSPKPASSAGQVALHLGHAANSLQDVDHIHVLMVGGALNKILCSYYALKTGQWVTSDSSNHTIGARYRRYAVPRTGSYTRSLTMTEREVEDREEAVQEATRFDMMPCRCSVCSTIEEEHGIEFFTEENEEQDATIAYKAMVLHNIHVDLERERYFQALLRAHYGDGLLTEPTITNSGVKSGGNEFWRSLNSQIRESKVVDLYHGMRFIEECVENGMEEADSKYKIKPAPDVQDGTIERQHSADNSALDVPIHK